MICKKKLFEKNETEGMKMTPKMRNEWWHFKEGELLQHNGRQTY